MILLILIKLIILFYTKIKIINILFQIIQLYYNLL